VPVREAGRVRIAQLNDCTVCLSFRADKVCAQGIAEDVYDAIGADDAGVLSAQERLAVEYAERFATNPHERRRRVRREVRDV
jgi:alkylhydroperoxidase family enzyme